MRFRKKSMLQQFSSRFLTHLCFYTPETNLAIVNLGFIVLLSCCGCRGIRHCRADFMAPCPGASTAINILHVQKCQWFWREEAAPAEPESCKAMTCQASTRSNLLTKSRITTTSSKVLSVAIIYKQASKKKFPPNVVTGI